LSYVVRYYPEKAAINPIAITPDHKLTF
jgi:hypothetical protein